MPTTPQFGRVAIIGTGLIGGSLALALRQRGLARHIVGCARTRATLATAQHIGAIDEGTTDPTAAVQSADLVVLAPPVRAILALFPQIAPHLKPDAVITDVGSTKVDILAAARASLSTPARFVPGHPMAGTEHAGIRAARADLFKGERWLLTPTEETDPNALAVVRALATGVGSRVLELPAALHDTLVAPVSQVPYLLSVALVYATAARRENGHRATDLAGPAYRGSVRLAASNPDMWGDILLTNRQAFADALADFRRELDTLADLVAHGEPDALHAALDQAVRWCGELPFP